MSDWGSLMVHVVAAGLARATPMLYAALGEVLAERSGVLNLGLEGVMLGSAMSGVAVAHRTGSVVAGLLAAIVVGILFGLLHAVICVTLRADQVVAGLSLVFLGTGLASVAGAPLVALGSAVPRCEPLPLPGLARIPILGEVLFQHNALVYGAILLAFILFFFIHRTRPGLALMATGEDPETARAMGIRVARMRIICTAAGGGLAGLGGASLSLAITPGWVEGMTAGQGWIAVALVIFARWNPLAVALGAFLFGVVRRLPLDLQGMPGFGDPNLGYFLNMTPYALTVMVLALASLKARRSPGKPAALGHPLDD